jgi:hypothetical protein
VYPTFTFAALRSRVTAVQLAGPVTTGVAVRDAQAFGRICVWPPGEVG